MDCEGCEVSLLGAEQAASLSGSALIVELHDFVDPRSSRSVVERSPLHTSASASPPHRAIPGDFPELEFLGWKNREQRVLAVVADGTIALNSRTARERYGLLRTGSNQQAVRQLADEAHIAKADTRTGWTVVDPLLQLWLRGGRSWTDVG